MTPGIDSLVSSDGDDWRNTAIIGGPWESDSSLAMGFFEIANIAVERWKAGRRNDAIVIPIIYNYRHGIELALKEEIRQAAACLRDDGVTDPGVQVDEVNNWVSATHSIEELVNRLTELIDQLDLGPDQQLPAETRDVLTKLHVLDQHGQAFRYSAVKPAPVARVPWSGYGPASSASTSWPSTKRSTRPGPWCCTAYPVSWATTPTTKPTCGTTLSSRRSVA